jgi:large subunit ribosomal protein L7Ae
VKNKLFENTPRKFGIGGNVQPKRDLTRFVRWPRYILLQRQKRILMKRLKVPPAINQFTKTVDSNQAKNLFRLLAKYPPEKKEDKKVRLVQAAKDKKALLESKDKKAAQKKTKGSAPVMLKFGLNQVTQLVENRLAKLVVIAANCDPIELVCWLPQLCRATDTPFCIVKSQAALGKTVGLKRTTCVAFTDVRKEDLNDLETLRKNFLSQYTQNIDLTTKYSKPTMGVKSRHIEEAHNKAIEQEKIQKVA